MIISAEILSAFPSIGSFSLDLQKFSKAIFLYAERALGYTTKKEANHLARDFFVRQSKHFEAALLRNLFLD